MLTFIVLGYVIVEAYNAELTSSLTRFIKIFKLKKKIIFLKECVKKSLHLLGQGI